jgi:hypothetical protein
MLPQERYRNKFMAALYGFFDESGKHHDPQTDVIVFSGTARMENKFSRNFDASTMALTSSVRADQ